MTVADHRSFKGLGAPSVGVGFKPEHFEAIVDTRPELGFFEVHAENYMGGGGAPHRRLDAIRERYPLSLHGVGLSIGSPGPLDRDHLQRLAAVAKNGGKFSGNHRFGGGADLTVAIRRGADKNKTCIHGCRPNGQIDRCPGMNTDTRHGGLRAKRCLPA